MRTSGNSASKSSSSFGRAKRLLASIVGATIEQLESRQLLSFSPMRTPAQLKIPSTWHGEPQYRSATSKYAKLKPDGTASPSGLTPAQMQGAYGVNNIAFGSVKGDGSGQTITIVDAYDYPSALADLNAFSAYFSLPQFNSGTGSPTFTKFNQNGATASLPGTDPSGAGNDWEIEEALDIEWAHSIAPKANIDLVEAIDASANLFTADQSAANLPGVSVVSNSWSGSEYSGENATDSIFNHTGVTFLDAAGDSGAYASDSKSITPNYPSSSPNVLSVGGTVLSAGAGNSYGSETAWGDGTLSGYQGGGGGGISSYESIPSYQVGKINGISSTSRTYPDVSLNAATGVPIYDTYDFGSTDPWAEYGGTSLSCPMWGGLIAIANQGRTLAGAGTLTGPTQTLPDLYSLSSSDFHDITTGNNGYATGPGYDLATGIGTPAANLLVSALATVAQSSTAPAVVVNPVSQTLAAGTSATFTAGASGSPTPAVQWMVETAGTSTFTAISGATATTLNLGATTLAQSGNNYEAVFSNGVGSPATTTAATLTVGVGPSITTNPKSQTVAAGQSVTFTAAATGTPTPSVIWMYLPPGATQFIPISGATSTTFTLGPATLSESGNLYLAVFTNVIGQLQTATATLTVNPATVAPAVTTNPTSETVTVGQTATFAAASSGTPTPTVQWMVETAGSSTFTAISGATSATLNLGATTIAQSGNKYEGVFSNGVGNPATTTPATLTVNPIPITGSLSGSASTAASAYNLTTLGTGDWAHWGLGGTYGQFDHKATGSSQISNVTQLGSGSYGGYYSSSRGVSWTDGTPLASESGDDGYIWANNAIGAGYSFTAPADTTTRTLYVYLGGYSSGSTLTATLSDNSATPYTVSFSGNALYTDLVAITYKAASASQKITISYTKSSNINGTGGSADLIAAWLVGAPVSTAPVVTTNPSSQTLTVGQDAAFTAAASGSPTPTVQWWEKQFGVASFVPIQGATSTTLDLGAATAAESGNQYEAVFSNGVGSVATTTAATVTVNTATATGSLTGSPSAAASSYNLTTLGTMDWAHWGAGVSASAFDHKSTGNSQISNVTKLGSGSYGAYYDSSRSVSWTDGTPQTSGTGDDGYLWANNAIGAGYSFTAPADTTTRTLYVYLGGYSSGSTLTATLSDGSATPYTISFSGNALYTDLVAITYKAASANQKITLSYTKSSNINGTGGSADLIAAWLA